MTDGCTHFKVFADLRFVGNSRVAPCSSVLEQRPYRRWLETHCDPADTILYVGIDHAEARRVPAIVRGWAPWPVRFPLCDPPYLSKADMLAAGVAAGLAPPRLDALGFAHNNCGGVCVRAGQGQWARLLEVFPDRYLAAERAEAALHAALGDVAILRDHRGGRARPLPLREFQQRR